MSLFPVKRLSRPFIWMGSSLAIINLWTGACAAPRSTAPAAFGSDLPQRPTRAPASATAGDSSELEADGSLLRYLAMALSRRPDLQALVHEAASARRLRGAEDVLPDPSISYSFFASSIETRLGPQRHKVSIRQAFPLRVFRDHASEERTRQAKALDARRVALGLQVRREVARAYWKRWLVEEERRIHMAHKDLVSDLYKTALARIEVGAGSLADAAQIDLRVTRLADMIEAMGAELALADSGLSLAVGEERAEVHALIDEPGDPARPGIDDADLHRLVAKHPALDAFEWQARAHDARGNREAARALPTVQLGVDYMEIGSLDEDLPFETGRDAVSAMVGLSIPIWRSSIRAKSEAAQHRARVSRAQGLRYLQKVQAAARDAAERVRDSARRIELYERQLLPQAESVYEARIGDYQVKSVSLANLLLAQEQILELRVAHARAQVDHEMAWADLEAAAGRTVPRAGKEGSASDE